MPKVTPLRPTELESVRLVVNFAPSIIDPVFGENSCIPTARVLVETFKLLGLPARALSVNANVANSQYLEVEKELGRGFLDREEAMQWHRKRGVFSYGVSGLEAPGHWNSHLVVILRQRVMIDLTIPQASHAEFGMIVEPFYAYVSGRFLNGVEPANFRMNGNRIRYEARVADRSYEATPNWRNPDCQALAQELEFCVTAAGLLDLDHEQITDDS